MTTATLACGPPEPRAARLVPPPPEVWVVLPTLEEVANLAAVVGVVRATLAGCAPGGFRVLVVDDASPDGTGEIADQLAAAHGDVEVLHRAGKAGLGPAYAAGFARALAGGARYVIQMDADRSHDPTDLPALLVPARADVVLGSRYVAGGGVRDWSRARRLLSAAGCRYARRVLGIPPRDLTGGFKCFRAAAFAGD